VPRSFRDAFDIGRSLTAGFEALKLAPLPLLLGAILMQCTESNGGNYGGGDGGGGGSWDEYDSWDNGDWESLGARMGELSPDLSSFAGSVGAAELGIIGIILLVLGGIFCCWALILVFRAWVHGGYIRLHREVIVSGEGRFGTLFGGADILLPVIGYKLMAWGIQFGIGLLVALPGAVLIGAGVFLDSIALAIIGLIVLLLLVLPVGIYLGLGLYFGMHAIALDDLGVMGALERSWDLARGNRLWLLLYMIVTGLVWMVGMCFCCVGIFVTRAVVDVARTECYLLATGERDDANWALRP